jgi:hypothetical protein
MADFHETLYDVVSLKNSTSYYLLIFSFIMSKRRPCEHEKCKQYRYPSVQDLQVLYCIISFERLQLLFTVFPSLLFLCLSTGKAPHTLNLSTRCRQLSSLTHSFYSGQKATSTHWTGGYHPVWIRVPILPTLYLYPSRVPPCLATQTTWYLVHPNQEHQHYIKVTMALSSYATNITRLC